MKNRHERVLLSILLTILIAANCVSPALAANVPTPQVVHLVSGETDADGNVYPDYVVDEHGNRFEQHLERGDRVRAASELPTHYDLRDYGLVTDVMHQGGAGSCWAISTVSSLESSYIRQGFGTLEDTDFSEAHLVWFAQRQRTTDPIDPTYGDGKMVSQPFVMGGNWSSASSQLMRGSGLQLEENAPWYTTYDADEMMAQMEQPESDRYVCYARMWSVSRICDNSAETLKRKIMQNGAATLSYYDDYMDARTGYNSTRTAYYQTTKVGVTNHAVTVVGWDDAYSRNNFNENLRPTSDGAWLVKGSWSTLWGDNGYYWISYEEPTLDSFVSFVAAKKDIYDKIYQYDGSYPRSYFTVPDCGTMANVFTAESDEWLTHVGIYSPNATPVGATVEVYTAGSGYTASSGNPTAGMVKVNAATTTVSSVEYGYLTVKLKNPVRLAKNQAFTISVTYTGSGTILIPIEGETISNPGDGVITSSGNVGESFLGYAGYWYDTNNYHNSSGYHDYNNVPVKAMTKVALSVQTSPVKTEYVVGECFDPTGLVLNYLDEQLNAYTVTEGYTFPTEPFSEAGVQTVEISYGGASVTIEVNVREPGRFLVGSATAHPGETVRIPVQIENNPGIITAMLHLSYDTDVLELIGVENGEIFDDTYFTPGGSLADMPYTTHWMDAHTHDAYTQNGTLATYIFRVRTDAPAGETALTVTYEPDSTFNVDMTNVSFIVQNGAVTVERLPGDVDADGVITLRDVVQLRRFLADWDVTINADGADVDADGLLTLQDCVRITRYLVGGYEDMELI